MYIIRNSLLWTGLHCRNKTAHIYKNSRKYQAYKSLRRRKIGSSRHSFKTKHAIEFNKAKLLAKIPYYFPRVIRETKYILKKEDNFHNKGNAT